MKMKMQDKNERRSRKRRLKEEDERVRRRRKVIEEIERRVDRGSWKGKLKEEI